MVHKAKRVPYFEDGRFARVTRTQQEDLRASLGSRFLLIQEWDDRIAYLDLVCHLGLGLFEGEKL